MSETFLFLLCTSYLFGLLFSFYQVPLFFTLLLFLPLRLYFPDKRFLLLLLGLSLFYLLGNFYFKGDTGDKPSERLKVLLRIERVEPYYEGRKVLASLEKGGKVEFTTTTSLFEPGSLCEVSLIKKRWFERKNPFTLGEEELLLIRGVEGLYRLDEREKIYCLRDKGGLVETLRFRLFQFSETLSPLAKGLFQALVLGVENQLPREYLETLKAQGLYHQLAISGFNLAILYGLFYKFFRFFLGFTPLLRLGIPLQLWAYVLALPGALLILFFSGFQPPTLRAFSFLLLLVLSKLLFRNTSGLMLLLLTGTLLVAIEPPLIGNASFQLSFLSTLALFLGDSLYKRCLSEEGAKTLLQRLFYGLFLSVMVSLFTLPILISIAGEFPLATPFNNLIATPFWSFIFIPFSIFSALLALLHESLARLSMEGVALVFSLYLKIPLFSLLYRISLPINLFLGWLFFLMFLFLILGRLKIRPYQKVLLFTLIGTLFYQGMLYLYQGVSFCFFPALKTMKALLIKERERFYLILEEGERSQIERETLFIPLLKRLGIKELEGLLFLQEAPLSSYQRAFSLHEVFQRLDLEEKRLFNPTLQVLPLWGGQLLIEFRGATFQYARGLPSKKRPLPRAEIPLNFYKAKDSAYFFFPKENYILGVKEGERRKDFLSRALFPLLPYYLEKGALPKLIYDREVY